MQSRITYRLQARHFRICRGCFEELQSYCQSRVHSLMYNGRTVVVDDSHGARSFTLPRAAKWAPDPGDLNVERGFIEKDSLLTVVDAVASHLVDATLSFYREERVVEANSFLKRQCIGFYTLQLQERSRSYFYADLAPEKLHRLCALHTLPKVATGLDGTPILLSSNAVGNIFHEYAHLLEMDFLGFCAAMTLKGKLVFTNQESISIFEDPTAQTVGFNAFTDDGRSSRRMSIIRHNALDGFLDSSSYPYRDIGCGYVGYGRTHFPIPRSTNLVVEVQCLPYTAKRYVLVTELDLQLQSGDPLETCVYIASGEGVYIEQDRPAFRLDLDFGVRTTLQKLVASMVFVHANPDFPSIGGMCIKGESQVRSAQIAPQAFLDMRALGSGK